MKIKLQLFSLVLFVSFALAAVVLSLLFDNILLQGLFLLIIAVIMHLLMSSQFIAPLQSLAEKMRKSVATNRLDNQQKPERIDTGLEQLYQYFVYLQNMVTHDRLTGLYNRFIFYERTRQSLNESKRSGRMYVLILLNIDKFRQLNTSKGHYIGDSILKQIAKRMLSGLRESDTVARFEKDNFAILMENQDNEQMGVLVNKIFNSLSRPYFTHGGKINISIRMGVATSPHHGTELDMLYRHADLALTRAKRNKQTIEFYEIHHSQDNTGLSRIQILRKALEQDEFKLVFQPVMDMKQYDTNYLEALLRWKEPTEHDFSIEQTISFAEKNQMILPLTEWVIQQACQLLNKLNNSDLKIGINLSMIDLHERDLPKRLQAYLHQYDIQGDQLKIEITEGLIMEDPDHVLPILGDIVALGVSLSIDDFGTGQASLTYLKNLPVEKIKIDQSFVKDLAHNSDDQLIVESTIKLAHSLGIKVVAEGVEDAQTYQILSNLDCDFAQGYYLSRPLESDKIEQWYINHKLNEAIGVS